MPFHRFPRNPNARRNASSHVRGAWSGADKPGVLVTTQGGNYDPGTPKEGWDHSTPWLRRVLEDVWGLDLRVVKRQFTLVGVNPALDAFTEVAAELKLEAEENARAAGRELALSREVASAG
ncbi:hypothetical protein GONAM_02_01340 [Gordonia namibiensis NBRC 108229]|uniref:Flavodoxin-like fold domain-containing protein n=2 Tax=Gordonia namibiensis TaxID=168480 RepID=K6X2K6_9ACTN|nr:hypothetical protein GONAM_02_01340 [Gordonia namibiensis NBRC 108229]